MNDRDVPDARDAPAEPPAGSRPERRRRHSDAELSAAELVLIASCGERIRSSDWDAMRAVVRRKEPTGTDAGRTGEQEPQSSEEEGAPKPSAG